VAGLNFSFSGLKTAVLYFVQKKLKENPQFVNENLNDVCASIQYTIVEILMDKLKIAVKETGINRIAIGGGVSANSGVRDALKEAETSHGWASFIPPFEFTTDNAAMIAIVGHLKYLNKEYANQTVMATARLKL
jgi:N6-L-threonylcarbamoyladenine synthase